MTKIRQNTKSTYGMPLIELDAIQYPNKLEQFIEISKMVGGNAVLLKENEDINELIRSLYPNALKTASNLPDIQATLNPDSVERPQDLNGMDLAIIRGEFGVAENGAVWVVQNVKERGLYFIAEYLVILLDKDLIVHHMHEAYGKVSLNDFGYGVFISGPSKTADIEQALVVGAHGAKGVTVILT